MRTVSLLPIRSRARVLAAAWCLAAALLPVATRPVAAQRTPSRILAAEAVVQGRGDAELRWPVSVAAGSAFQIAVADAYGARLVLFAESGRGVADAAATSGFASGIGWSAAGIVELPAAPLAVVYDGPSAASPRGRYVVALRGRGNLATVAPLHSSQGPVQGVPGSLALPEGTVPGALAAAADGRLLVYDAAGSRVLALDGDARPSAGTPVSGRLTALAAAAGGFFAVFADQARVVRYGPGGRVLGEWQVPGDAPKPAWPDGLVVEPSGGLLIADRHAGRVVALDAAGRLTGVGSARGWQIGRLLSPAGMTRLPDGRLVVADRGNGRVQIFRTVAGKRGPRAGSSP